MRYLKVAKDIHIGLRQDNTNIIKWNIDASHSFQNHMIGHTGVIFKMLKGGIVSKYMKHILNTKNSTEPYLVGIDDAMADDLWMFFFVGIRIFP